MNQEKRSQFKAEYAKLSLIPSIKLAVSDALAIIIIIQMQKAYRISESADRETMDYLVGFCRELLESVSVSTEFKDVLNYGWDCPTEFNNPSPPPDELN